MPETLAAESLAAEGLVAEPSGPAPPRLRPIWTILSALVLLPVIAFVVMPVAPSSRLAGLSSPERALALVVGRAMDLREGVARAAPWERRLHRVLGIEGADDLGQAITWYEELAGHSMRPAVHLQLAVLLAEAGRLDEFQDLAAEWETRPEPFPLLARIAAAVYLGEAPMPSGTARVADLLGDGWFADRFAIAAARRIGDPNLERAATERLVARSRALLVRARGLIASLVIVMVTGGVAAVVIVARSRRAPGAFAIGTAPIPPPWSGRLGAAVLLRGGALAALAAMPLLVMPVGRDERVLGVFEILVGVVIAVPVLILAHRYLLRPTGVDVSDGLGLRVAPVRVSRLWLVIPAVIVLGLGGDWLIGTATDLVRTPGHWTEWFEEDLVFGGPAAFVASLCGAVVIAPVTEELTFRGVLFVTLRRRLAWPLAAVVSGAAFAVLHGYGIAGFASVWWSGVAWAWTYERTRSLWPSIAAHAFGNLWASAVVVTLFRS